MADVCSALIPRSGISDGEAVPHKVENKSPEIPIHLPRQCSTACIAVLHKAKQTAILKAIGNSKLDLLSQLSYAAL